MFGQTASLLFVALGATLAGVLAFAYTLAAVYALVTFSHWLVDRRIRGVEPDDPNQTHLDALGGTFTAELISAGALFALHPLGMIDPPKPAPRLLRSGRPILLVHGFMQTRSSFALLAPRLSGCGLGPIYSINLPALDVNLLHQAQLLSERIDQIRLATGAKTIDVVAHSTGGLAVRLAERGRHASRIRRLVTLGTPHHGTQVAHVVFGPVARDMRPGSDLLLSLPIPPVGQLVSISSSHDFCVIPPESAQVGPLGRDILVQHVGHLALLTDARVSLEVIKALGEDIQVLRSQDLFDPVDSVEPEFVVSP